jgi:hypothetical protein
MSTKSRPENLAPAEEVFDWMNSRFVFVMDEGKARLLDEERQQIITKGTLKAMFLPYYARVSSHHEVNWADLWFRSTRRREILDFNAREYFKQQQMRSRGLCAKRCGQPGATWLCNQTADHQEPCASTPPRT